MCFVHSEIGRRNISKIYRHHSISVRHMHFTKDSFESNSCWLIYFTSSEVVLLAKYCINIKTTEFHHSKSSHLTQIALPKG